MDYAEDYSQFLKIMVKYYRAFEETLKQQDFTGFELRLLNQNDEIFHKPSLTLSFKCCDLLARFLDDYIKLTELEKSFHWDSLVHRLIELFFHKECFIKLHKSDCEAGAIIFENFYYYVEATENYSKDLANLFLNLYDIFYKCSKYNLKIVGTYEVCMPQFSEIWSVL